MTGLVPQELGGAGTARQPASSFELVFRPSAALISLVRTFVQSFYERSVPDPDTAQRLALTTHELLENAAKYSSDGEASLWVEYDPASGSVVVRASNRASAGQIALVKRFFAEIASVPDAGAFYAEAMRRTAVKATGSGGLGLARIWAESEMDLELIVENDRVDVHARGRVDIAAPGRDDKRVADAG